MATISLKKLVDGSPVQIEESDILVVYGTSTDAIVEYVNSQSGRKEKVEVDNAVAEIADVSEKLFEISVPDYPSTTVYLNSDRVMNIYEDNSVAVVIYDRAASAKARFITDESKEDVLTRIYEKNGYYTYEVDDYSGDTIRLTAGTGDVTAKFTNGKIITVYGALEENNGTYEVDSSTFGGGKTTITLAVGTGVADDTDATGRIMIKSLSQSALETVVQGITDGTSSFDTISEKTAAAGVTVDGVLLKDSTVLTGSGAVGAPAVKVGYADTGLYAVSATQTGFSQDGALVALFDSNGFSADSVRPRVAQATAGAGVTMQEYGDGRDFTTVLTLGGFPMAIVGAANEAVGHLLMTFPAGAHLLSATHMSVALQGGGTVDTDTPDVGLGTVEATGAVALLGGTAAFEDIIDGQTAADCNGTATVAFLKPDDELSATGDVKAVYLNIADGWAGGDTINVTGTIVLKWTKMS